MLFHCGCRPVPSWGIYTDWDDDELATSKIPMKFYVPIILKNRRDFTYFLTVWTCPELNYKYLEKYWVKSVPAFPSFSETNAHIARAHTQGWCINTRYWSHCESITFEHTCIRAPQWCLMDMPRYKVSGDEQKPIGLEYCHSIKYRLTAPLNKSLRKNEWLY